MRLSSTNDSPEANHPETLLNREFSHQVLVLAETVGGKTLDKATGFHDKPVFQSKPRGPTLSAELDESLKGLQLELWR